MIFLLPSPGDSGFLIIICAIIYFVPSFVAYKREKRDFTAILLINIFLGWTLIGWVVALIWAVSSDKKITDREKMLQLQEENNRLLNALANQNKISQANINNVRPEDSEDLLEKALSTLENKPNTSYDEDYEAIFSKKKPFYKNTSFLIFIGSILIVLLLMYLNNESSKTPQLDEHANSGDFQNKSDFDIKFNDLNFIYNNGHINFGCKLIMTNNTDYTFSNLIFSEKNLIIEYSNNTSDQYDMFLMGEWKFKPGSTNKIDMAISPFTNNRPYITMEDFQRTPVKAVMKCSFNAVSLDKEIPESFEVDVLPEWIYLQKQIGIR